MAVVAFRCNTLLRIQTRGTFPCYVFQMVGFDPMQVDNEDQLMQSKASTAPQESEAELEWPPTSTHCLSRGESDRCRKKRHSEHPTTHHDHQDGRTERHHHLSSAQHSSSHPVPSSSSELMQPPRINNKYQPHCTIIIYPPLYLIPAFTFTLYLKECCYKCSWLGHLKKDCLGKTRRHPHLS